MKAFDLESRYGKVVQGIALVPNVGLKTQCIRVGRAQQARWVKRSSNEQTSAVYNDAGTRVLDCGIEIFTAEGAVYHSMVNSDPDDNRALLRITTMPTAATTSPDKGCSRALFGDPFRGLVGYGTTPDAFKATWEEALYVLRPVSLPDRALDAILVHTLNTPASEDFVVIYKDDTIVLLSYDEFLSKYVHPWIASATPEEFQLAFTQANERQHREMAQFLRQTYAIFSSL